MNQGTGTGPITTRDQGTQSKGAQDIRLKGERPTRKTGKLIGTNKGNLKPLGRLKASGPMVIGMPKLRLAQFRA